MKNWKRIMVFILGVLLITLTSACGTNSKTSSNVPTEQKSSSTPSPEPKKLGTIRIGMVAAPIGPVIVAINDGSYKAAGLEIETVSFSSGADAVQALVGGSLDLNMGSYEHVLSQAANGLDIKAFALLNNSSMYSLVVRSDSPIKDLSELKGKILGVTKAGSLSDTTLKEILKIAKLDPVKDVEIINAGTGATMLAAIQSGKVAAGMVNEPTTSQMVVSGEYKVLYDPNYDTAGLVLMGKSKWAEKNAEALRAFLKVTKDALKRSTADISGTVNIVKKQYPELNEKELTRAFSTVLAKIPADLKVTRAGADQILRTQIEVKVISKDIPFEQCVDHSYLP